MDTPLLKLIQIQKSFGAVRALKGVCLDLLPGEVHAVLGENGAGKSTLIKIITGAHSPDSGEIHFQNRRVDSLSPASARALGIACIYQQPALFPDLPVWENIGLRMETGSVFRRVNRSARRSLARKLLDQLGAPIDLETEVRSLSMPEQQLVEIACALGAGARVLIMDEPTASLTQPEQQKLLDVVRELRRSGVGIIYISHRLEEIFAVADRITILRDGESVGTSAVAGMSETELIQRMVGRAVDQEYPPAEGVAGKTVLTLANVGCQNSRVSQVSLELRAGEILGLAGLVGAGRTELARVLFGITPADSGEIKLLGRVIQIASPAEAVAHGIAYLPEDRRRHGVIPELSIAANISLAVLHRLFPKSWLRTRSEEALAEDYISKLSVKTSGPLAPVASLSGGNQQKVALARWLATRPKVLILDEPTQGVDVGAKSELHKIIRSLCREGVAILMISSDLPEILGLSDRIGVMRGGTLVALLPGGSTARAVMTAALGQAALVEATA